MPGHRDRQLVGLARRGQHVDGAARRVGCVVPAVEQPERPREVAERAAERHQVAVRLGRVDDLLESLDRADRLVGQPRHRADREERGRPLLGRGGREHALPLGERLAKGSGAFGLGRGGRGVSRDQPILSRRGRVIGDPRVIGARRRRERLGDRAVEERPPRRRDRVLDGGARQLVAELELPAVGDEDAGRDALLDGGGVRTRDAHEQRRIDVRADRRRDVERPARRRRQPRRTREHGVAHGRRQPVRRGERLRDEERVAAGRLEQPPRVEAGLGRERADGVRREPPRLEPDDVRGRRDVPREHADRLVGRAVVAVGHEQHGRNALEPARREPQHVERRPVRPVAILHDDDGRASRGDGRQQRPRDRRRVRRLGDRIAEGRGDVVQRPERRGHGERLAAPDVHRHVRARRERPDERRLADARLAGEKHDGSATLPRGAERRLERGQLDVALEERTHRLASLVAVVA